MIGEIDEPNLIAVCVKLDKPETDYTTLKVPRDKSSGYSLPAYSRFFHL